MRRYEISRLVDEEYVADAFEALNEVIPAWSEILCFVGGYTWKQSWTHLAE
jgi:hypothetical protein